MASCTFASLPTEHGSQLSMHISSHSATSRCRELSSSRRHASSNLGDLDNELAHKANLQSAATLSSKTLQTFRCLLARARSQAGVPQHFLGIRLAQRS